MRKIETHKVGVAEVNVHAIDERGPGGASHQYEISVPHPHAEQMVSAARKSGMSDDEAESHGRRKLAILQFQKGPIGETGNNGITQEALIAICIDRLQSFQAGPFACRDNAIALTHLEDALLRLQKRTRDRLARGVEGTNAK